MNDGRLILLLSALHLVALVAGSGLLMLALRSGGEHCEPSEDKGGGGSPHPPRRPIGGPSLPTRRRPGSACAARHALRISWLARRAGGRGSGGEQGGLADDVGEVRAREARRRTLCELEATCDEVARARRTGSVRASDRRLRSAPAAREGVHSP